MAKILVNFENYQQIPYQLKPMPEMREWLNADLIRYDFDEITLTKMSRFLEPSRGGQSKAVLLPPEVQDIYASKDDGSFGAGFAMGALKKTRDLFRKKNLLGTLGRGRETDMMSMDEFSETEFEKSGGSYLGRRKKTSPGMAYIFTGNSIAQPPTNSPASVPLDPFNALLLRLNDYEAAVLGAHQQRISGATLALNHVVTSISGISDVADIIKRESFSEIINQQKELDELKALVRQREGWVPKDVHDKEIAQLSAKIAELEGDSSKPRPAPSASVGWKSATTKKD